MEKKNKKTPRKRYKQKGVEDSGLTRMRLYPDEVNVVTEYRTFHNMSTSRGVDPKDVHFMWIKDKEASLKVHNPNFKGKLDDEKKFKEDLLKSLKGHSPKYPKIKRQKTKDGHLLVIDPADVHIGKLCSAFETGEEYNSQMAVQRVLEGVDGIINKSNGFKVDKINLILGNDILHVDGPNNTTTSGTRQDVSGMFYDNFLMAKQLYVDVIEKLITIADVHCTFNPSNHDYMSGWLLAEIIQTHFRHSKNITFDCSMSHRKGFKYFNNLIGTTHGDGAKQNDLPLLMATEFPKEWSETKHRYIYLHHFHHKMSKDHIGITLETLRSPSPADSWHHRNGYQHAPQAIEGFIHHKEHGQIARLTHYF